MIEIYISTNLGSCFLIFFSTCFIDLNLGEDELFVRLTAPDDTSAFETSSPITSLKLQLHQTPFNYKKKKKKKIPRINRLLFVFFYA